MDSPERQHPITGSSAQDSSCGESPFGAIFDHLSPIRPTKAFHPQVYQDLSALTQLPPTIFVSPLQRRPRPRRGRNLSAIEPGHPHRGSGYCSGNDGEPQTPPQMTKHTKDGNLLKCTSQQLKVQHAPSAALLAPVDGTEQAIASKILEGDSPATTTAFASKSEDPGIVCNSSECVPVVEHAQRSISVEEPRTANWSGSYMSAPVSSSRDALLVVDEAGPHEVIGNGFEERGYDVVEPDPQAAAESSDWLRSSPFKLAGGSINSGEGAQQNLQNSADRHVLRASANATEANGLQVSSTAHINDSQHLLITSSRPGSRSANTMKAVRAIAFKDSLLGQPAAPPLHSICRTPAPAGVSQVEASMSGTSQGMSVVGGDSDTPSSWCFSEDLAILTAAQPVEDLADTPSSSDLTMQQPSGICGTSQSLHDHQTNFSQSSILGALARQVAASPDSIQQTGDRAGSTPISGSLMGSGKMIVRGLETVSVHSWEDNVAEHPGVMAGNGVKRLSVEYGTMEMDNTEGEETSRSSNGKKRVKEAGECRRCSCKKSRCLKLYCDCFRSGLFCIGPCRCEDCQNTKEFEKLVKETREQIEVRNPNAFTPRIVQDTDQANSVLADERRQEQLAVGLRHKSGCNCKKSMCLKKYCECYQAGVGCSDGCRCEGCQNPCGQRSDDLEPKEFPLAAGIAKGFPEESIIKSGMESAEMHLDVEQPQHQTGAACFLSPSSADGKGERRENGLSPTTPFQYFGSAPRSLSKERTPSKSLSLDSSGELHPFFIAPSPRKEPKRASLSPGATLMCGNDANYALSPPTVSTGNSSLAFYNHGPVRSNDLEAIGSSSKNRDEASHGGGTSRKRPNSAMGLSTAASPSEAGIMPSPAIFRTPAPRSPLAVVRSSITKLTSGAGRGARTPATISSGLTTDHSLVLEGSAPERGRPQTKIRRRSSNISSSSAPVFAPTERDQIAMASIKEFNQHSLNAAISGLEYVGGSTDFEDDDVNSPSEEQSEGGMELRGEVEVNGFSALLQERNWEEVGSPRQEDILTEEMQEPPPLVSTKVSSPNKKRVSPLKQAKSLQTISRGLQIVCGGDEPDD